MSDVNGLSGSGQSQSSISRGSIAIAALIFGTVGVLIYMVGRRAGILDSSMFSYVETGAILFAALTVAFLISILVSLRSHRSWNEFLLAEEREWNGMMRFVSFVAPSLVRPMLFCALGIILYIVFRFLRLKPHPEVACVALLGVCALPMLFTLCATLLVERRVARSNYELAAAPGTHLSTSEFEEIKQVWDYEGEYMRESVQRMARHGGILGFVGSALISACIVLVFSSWNKHWIIAKAVGIGVMVSFVLNLGRILFRSASNDATARMMAWAARTLLIVAIATIFIALLVLENEVQLTNVAIKGSAGAPVVGVAVALVGERILRVITHNAANVLGMQSALPPVKFDLDQIEGLTEDNVVRLEEELVDSVHALAFIPTPRLFMNTVYSLPRICDWQDQALLITRLGRINAQVLREKLLVRGAIAAQDLATDIVKYLDARRNPQPGQPAEGSDEKARNENLAKALGFGQLDDAYHGLKALSEDLTIRRLRAFTKSVAQLRAVGEDAGNANGGNESSRAATTVYDGLVERP